MNIHHLVIIFRLIKPDMKDVIYCNGIRNGGVEEWNFLYQKYKTANVASEAARILDALTCSKEPWILNRLAILQIKFTGICGYNFIYILTIKLLTLLFKTGY